MDPRLLRLYTDELNHLQEVGQEFAQAFPQVAARLGMETLPVADPYVERLLEGFAFMAARVQLKIEAEQPRLIAHLLEAIYPNFLVPVPSMLVTRLRVDANDPNLVRGHVFPRGSLLRSTLRRGQDTACEFTTAHAVTLWPIELVSAQVFSHAPDLGLQRITGQVQGVRSGLRIRLRAGGGLTFAQLALDRLPLHICAPDAVAARLHELALGACLGSLVCAADDTLPQWRGPASVRPLGYAADEALLPEQLRAFSGHRLVQELAAMPQRFMFFEIADLAPRLARVASNEVDLVLLFARADPGLEALVDAASLALFCTPAINLFRKRIDRIQLGPGAWDYHVVPDRTRPADFEVHSLETVTGHGAGRTGPQDFLPLYAAHHGHAVPRALPGYHTVRREPRLLSPRQREHGTRSSYVGDEVFIALTDPQHAPYRDDIRQLSVQAWVTNRDLPTLLPQGGTPDPDAPPQWVAESPGPVLRVDCLRGPTRPVSRRPVGEIGWRLVNHLTLNHLSLVDVSPQQAAATLRTTLALYGPPDDAAWTRQLDGLRALQAQTVVRRLPYKGPISFGTGIEFALELDELAFQGSSAFLFASVVECFLARHAAINTFTQLRLTTPQRGELMRWPVRAGSRDLA